MQFSRLRLQGFKSFVDPTELVISDGLTGVVGPNGCGKSNLLEALRWVMGENRARAMRGEGMEDVIFAGSDRRPARGSASVDLVVDNSDRLAPAAFNAEDRIEVSRRITRDIGSAFVVNGKNARARDVQMLFADASTGAHSPALVRQGQIGELISAKPKARRRILEEAAGISGLYQRRHEAELKLNAAAQNLERLEEVLGRQASQLSSLERQAAQAERYRKIAEALRHAEALALWLAWREAEDQRGAAEGSFGDAERAASTAEAAAVRAATARAEASDALPPLREEAAIAAAVLQRLAIEAGQQEERERAAEAQINRLAGRRRQLERDLEREDGLGRDAAGAIDRLSTEETELAAAEEAAPGALAAAEAEARLKTEAMAAEEARLDRLGEEAARLTARVQAARKAGAEARDGEARLARETAAEEEKLARSEEALARLAGARETADTARHAAEVEASAADAALSGADTARQAAEVDDQTARAALADAEGRLGALTSEIRGLERMIAEDRMPAASLLDAIRVAPGLEAAFGAAFEDELERGMAEGPGTGWRGLDPLATPPSLPTGAQPIAGEVEAPEVLARRLGQIGLVDAAEGDALQGALLPGQRLVSRDGDMWRWDGYRRRAGDGASAAGIRLERRNRLADLAARRVVAESAKTTAETARGDARAGLQQVREAEAAARSQLKAAEQALAAAGRAMAEAEAEATRLEGTRDLAQSTLEARRGELARAAARLAEAEDQLRGLEDPEAARAAVEAQRQTVEAARSVMIAARSRAAEIRNAADARAERRAAIAAEIEAWERRQAGAGDRIADLERRIARTAEELSDAKLQPAHLSAARERIEREKETAAERDRAARDRLAAAEMALSAADRVASEAERAASSARELRARAETRLESAVERVAEACAALEPDHGSPEALAERLEIDPAAVPSREEAEREAAKLRRQRDSLGAVNLRAAEDAAEIRGEMEGLAAEKADLDAAIAKLRSGIGELNREGRQRLLAAFDQVNTRFSELFRHLFGGGEARLVMVESEDPLEAGLEILCQPPGKKLSTLSLLSGGEQTLTALSLIFAVFLCQPSPVCVLDEVDAPLDDAHVTRFCDLLDEMVRLTRTRFLIITHHPLTMSRMDRLFGVTMVEQGVSQLVSVDLTRAAEMVEG